MARKLTEEQKEARAAKRKQDAADAREKKAKAKAAEREKKAKAKAAEKEAKKKADEAAKKMAKLEAAEEKARKKSEAAQKRADAKAAADQRRADEQREKAERIDRLFEIEKAKHDKQMAAYKTAKERNRAIARGEAPRKPRRMPNVTNEGGVKTTVRLRRNPDKGYKRRAYVSNRGKLDDGDNRVAYPGENKKHPRDVYVSDKGNFFRVYGEQGE